MSWWKNDKYHLAEKKIPSIHGQTVGYKLEQFIFDAFPYAPSTELFEVACYSYFYKVGNLRRMTLMTLFVCFILGIARRRIRACEKCKRVKLWHPRQCTASGASSAYTLGGCSWRVFNTLGTFVFHRLKPFIIINKKTIYPMSDC